MADPKRILAALILFCAAVVTAHAQAPVYSGVLVAPAPTIWPARLTPPAIEEVPMALHTAPLDLGLDFQYRYYNNWDKVLDAVTGAAETDGSNTGLGVGLSVEYRPFNFPIYTGISGYCVGGLDANITLANGRNLTSDVTDCGGGFNLRFYPLVKKKFRPYIAVGVVFERNSNDYNEYSGSGDLVFSETRTLSSWTGIYQGGLVYWPVSTLGIDFGIGYQGRFKDMNADEQWKLSTGLVLGFGKR